MRSRSRDKEKRRRKRCEDCDYDDRDMKKEKKRIVKDKDKKNSKSLSSLDRKRSDVESKADIEYISAFTSIQGDPGRSYHIFTLTNPTNY